MHRIIIYPATDLASACCAPLSSWLIAIAKFSPFAFLLLCQLNAGAVRAEASPDDAIANSVEAIVDEMDHGWISVIDAQEIDAQEIVTQEIVAQEQLFLENEPFPRKLQQQESAQAEYTNNVPEANLNHSTEQANREVPSPSQSLVPEGTEEVSLNKSPAVEFVFVESVADEPVADEQVHQQQVHQQEAEFYVAERLENAPSNHASDLLAPTNKATPANPVDLEGRAATIGQQNGGDRTTPSNPDIQLQGVFLVQGDEVSARARASGVYVVNPSLLFGATVDVVTGEAFGDAAGEVELNLNELYATASLFNSPNLRLVVGLMDLTSYFDRNSFAKDGATQFFNPVFQTNPALASAGVGSRPGVLLGWDVTDNLSLRAATYASSRDLGEFALDAAAAEVALRLGTLILRGTYATNQDAGTEDGFREIGQLIRGDGSFGVQEGDREVAYGLNAELFIPGLNLGLFGRYGWYDNRTLDRGGQTYSLGLNLLDVFLPADRLGLAYGRQLSNNGLRQQADDTTPDVWELFYDARLARSLRAGISLQGRNEFSETVLGVRIRTDFRL